MIASSRCLALSSLLMFHGSPLLAGTLSCGGTVEQLAFHAPGRVMVRLSSMNTPVFVCPLDVDWSPSGQGYVTTPASCKALHATLVVAKLSRDPLDYIHFDGDEVPASCNAWAAWANAHVRFFRTASPS